jgi:hypothetical protein
MPKASRAKFEFERVVKGKGPVTVTVRASSYLNDDVRNKMIPMLDAASYMVNRIIHRLRRGINAEGGANPPKDNGKPRTFYQTGYMFRNFKPKAASPIKVAYSFTGAHKEPTRQGFTKRQTGHEASRDFNEYNWVSVEALPGEDELAWTRDRAPLVLLSDPN